MSDSIDGPDSRPGIRDGAFLCAGAGLVWWVAAATHAPGATAGLIVLGLLCTATLVWFTRRRLADSGEGLLLRAQRRRYAAVNVVQLGAILLSIAVCASVGRSPLIPALITLIVGVHFFPVARLMRRTAYAKLAIALIVIGALGLVYGVATDEVDRPLVFVGMAGSVAFWVVPTSALLGHAVRDRPALSPFRLERADEGESWGLSEEEWQAERAQLRAEQDADPEWEGDEGEGRAGPVRHR